MQQHIVSAFTRGPGITPAVSETVPELAPMPAVVSHMVNQHLFLPIRTSVSSLECDDHGLINATTGYTRISPG
jgi:hypothetical protein